MQSMCPCMYIPVVTGDHPPHLWLTEENSPQGLHSISLSETSCTERVSEVRSMAVMVARIILIIMIIIIKIIVVVAILFLTH